ncbi:Cobyrinic acid ac-diamide synthase [Fervidobacterium nodosum Rt17-B1]|uniref:Cobyrinic acid ac-diamide synthase n=2 Tax=Fervidobacterium nodosum TaxID=2424 RepID=A7HMT3_FERNB|nr:Cobyrinic acid ac-diamide synthase [Fervidobacterium nodosum Rt17-B1]PHJ13952.1 hypothetical protein IM41_03460 [Fervidobacterium sp. SC_NGM5_G05]
MFLMVQGTMSNVGKSTITLALCRYFTNKGLNVFPFKAQNISSKFVDIGDVKIASAQYFQAIACKKEPHVYMNPLLIVPRGKLEAYFLGEYVDSFDSREYMYDEKKRILEKIIDILKDLERENDLVIIEGAGSCAEPNLRDREIVNMRIAMSVQSSVVLVADISLGGAFAQVAGTMELLEGNERSLVKGFIFNKFHGDKTLLGDFPNQLAQRYSIEYFGTIPYLENKLPDEDLKVSKFGELNTLEDISAIDAEIERITEHVISNIQIQKLERILGL